MIAMSYPSSGRSADRIAKCADPRVGTKPAIAIHMTNKKLSPKQAQVIANIKAGICWTSGIQHGHMNILKSLCKMGAVTCDESGYPTVYTVNPGW